MVTFQPDPHLSRLRLEPAYTVSLADTFVPTDLWRFCSSDPSVYPEYRKLVMIDINGYIWVGEAG